MTYAYLRVSGPTQARDDKDGLPRQKEACLRFAVANNLTVKQWFQEPGESGSDDVMDRKALFELLETVKTGDTVLIDRLDRLARQVGIQEYILLKLRRKGVKVISTSPSEKADATDPVDIAVRQMFGVFAQLEAAMIQRRTSIAKAKKRKLWREGKGPRCDGRKPYGEHKDPEKRAAEIRGLEMIRNADRAMTSDDLAVKLDEAGIPTRSGRPWQGKTVRNIRKRLRAEAAKQMAA